MVVKKNISLSVVPEEIIQRMVQAIDGKGPADLARDLSVSVNNFSNWKTDGVSVRMVFRFAEKHSVSLDWLFWGKESAPEIGPGAIMAEFMEDFQALQDALEQAAKRLSQLIPSQYRAAGEESSAVPSAPFQSVSSKKRVKEGTSQRGKR